MMLIRIWLTQSQLPICFSHSDILDLTTCRRSTINSFTLSFQGDEGPGQHGGDRLVRGHGVRAKVGDEFGEFEADSRNEER
jgi:hypothetical protein